MVLSIVDDVTSELSKGHLSMKFESDSRPQLLTPVNTCIAQFDQVSTQKTRKINNRRNGNAKLFEGQ